MIPPSFFEGIPLYFIIWSSTHAKVIESLNTRFDPEAWTGANWGLNQHPPTCVTHYIISTQCCISCSANQMTGFHTKWNTGNTMKWVCLLNYLVPWACLHQVGRLIFNKFGPFDNRYYSCIQKTEFLLLFVQVLYRKHPRSIFNIWILRNFFFRNFPYMELNYFEFHKF